VAFVTCAAKVGGVIEEPGIAAVPGDVDLGPDDVIDVGAGSVPSAKDGNPTQWVASQDEWASAIAPVAAVIRTLEAGPPATLLAIAS
jgi:hypothetical protein